MRGPLCQLPQKKARKKIVTRGSGISGVQGQMTRRVRKNAVFNEWL
jgi:hypothetical protein